VYRNCSVNSFCTGYFTDFSRRRIAMRSHSLNLLTANCLQQRFAIAPLQLPQTSFFNEPQRHRGYREREIAPLNSQTAIAPPQPPK
ncbi:MAG: hypothetical protein ACK52E_16140, partial [Aphanizomenon sp.]